MKFSSWWKISILELHCLISIHFQSSVSTSSNPTVSWVHFLLFLYAWISKLQGSSCRRAENILFSLDTPFFGVIFRQSNVSKKARDYWARNSGICTTSSFSCQLNSPLDQNLLTAKNLSYFTVAMKTKQKREKGQIDCPLYESKKLNSP